MYILTWQTRHFQPEPWPRLSCGLAIAARSIRADSGSRVYSSRRPIKIVFENGARAKVIRTIPFDCCAQAIAQSSGSTKALL